MSLELEAKTPWSGARISHGSNEEVRGRSKGHIIVEILSAASHLGMSKGP